MFGTLSHDKEWKTEWTFATTVVFMNSVINPIRAIVKTTKKLLFQQTDEK